MSSDAIDTIIKIDANDIEIGKPLPWPVFNREQRLLLKAGAVVASQRQVEILMSQGLYRPLSESEIAELENSKTDPQPHERRSNPFLVKQEWSEQLNALFTRIQNPIGNDGMEHDLLALADAMLAVAKDRPDALLSAIHLTRSFDYAVLHPIHTAVLCTLLVDRLQFDPEREHIVIAAALAMNVGMLDLQRVLFKQMSPLTEDQKTGVRNHPETSVQILKDAGFSNELLLRTILQHHEKLDGSGYPGKCSADEISQEARILSISDIYAAMVTPREYRKSVPGHDALKKIFMSRGKVVDESLASLLIREIGLYPPGTFVKIANGDIAVVARRPLDAAKHAKNPMVFSVISPRGGMYEQPIKRDTNQDQYKILSAELPKLDSPLDTQMIWGLKFS